MSSKETYIDLTEEECVWLKRTLAKYTESDHAFSIRCKLTDSMQVNNMRPEEPKDYETDHPATTGVEAYAADGRAYYKTAAKAQMAIGIGISVQAIATTAVAIMLAFALFGCAGVRHASTIKAVVENANQPVKSVSGSFKSKQFRVEFFDQPNQ